MSSFGLIGVGFMGRGIARNLILKGKQGNPSLSNIFLYDQNQSQIDGLLGEISYRDDPRFPKVHKASHHSNMLNNTNVLAISLPSEDICSDVLFHPESGLVTSYAKTANTEDQFKIIVDHGTYSKSFVTYCHEKAKDIAGVHYVDAPVSGGPQGAWNGSLSIMIGTDPSILPHIIPFIELYSAKLKHFGLIGSGMAAKLVNQALVGIHAQAACEAIRLADRLGLKDMANLQDLLSSSWGQSKVLELVFADYNLMNPKGNLTLDQTADRLNKYKSPAPLRNMIKDFECIEKEITCTDKCGDYSSFPLTLKTKDNMALACNQMGLRDSPFASLLAVNPSKTL